MIVLSGTGICGKDAEVRYLQSGMAVLNVSVAVKSGFGDKEQTIWLNVSLFGKKAEGGLKDWLKKGQGVAFSGEFSIREYEQNGVKRNSYELNAHVFELNGKKADSQPSQAKPQSQHHAAKSDGGGAPYDDDIPF